MIKLSALVGLFAVARVVSAQQGAWQQCGGNGWTGGTTCISGYVCTRLNDWYSQCIPGSQVPTSSARPTTTVVTTRPPSTSQRTSTTLRTTGAPVTSATPGPVPSGNPYEPQYSIVLNPLYTEEVNAAADAITNTTLAAAARRVANIPTFYWLDVARKVPILGQMLADIRATGGTKLLQIVVYDLPDRDCAALASNGEFSIANGGEALYKKYIDDISALVTQYSDIRIVAVVEPDSLANMVTNMNVTKCQNAAPYYRSLTSYAISKLQQNNIYLYLDAGHAGWLGWPDNISRAATLFGEVLRNAGTNARVRGLATNVANYNALRAATRDPVTNPNPNYDEQHYIDAIAPMLTNARYPAHFIVDQGRSGVQNIRQAWGDWCNVRGAGFGTRPTTNTGSSLIDAIVWVKPGGESDGTSDTSAARYDAMCGKDSAHKPAPEAGQWFQAFFENLVRNANPAI